MLIMEWFFYSFGKDDRYETNVRLPALFSFTSRNAEQYDWPSPQHAGYIRIRYRTRLRL